MDFDLAIQEDASLIMLNGYELGNSYQKLPAFTSFFKISRECNKNEIERNY
jgi:hypothetical protein